MVNWLVDVYRFIQSASEVRAKYFGNSGSGAKVFSEIFIARGSHIKQTSCKDRAKTSVSPKCFHILSAKRIYTKRTISRDQCA